MTVINYMQVSENKHTLALNSPSMVDRTALAAAGLLTDTFIPTVTIRGALLRFSDLRYDQGNQRLSLRTGVQDGRPVWEHIHQHPLIMEELLSQYDAVLDARLRALREDVEERDYYNVWTKK
jgi:hypothetical protein